MAQISKRKRTATVKTVCSNCGGISYTQFKCKPADFRNIIFNLYTDDYPNTAHSLEIEDPISLYIHSCSDYHVGINEIVAAWLDPPSPDDIYTGTICDICGQTVKMAEKGRHIIERHPEYKIQQVGRPYQLEYRCGFCDFWRSSPAAVVKHVQAVHNDRITV